MAITITLDAVDGSQLQRTGQNGYRALRMGIAENLPLTGVNKEDILFLVLSAPGMPQTSDTYPGRPNLFLSDIVILGLTPQYAKFQLIYESFGGAGVTATIIEVAGGDCAIETNMMPGSQEPFEVQFQPESDSKELPIPPSLVTMSINESIVQITATQLRNGVIAPSIQASFAANSNKCNSDPWMGRDKGSWRINAAVATASKYDARYQTRISAIARESSRWSYFGIVQSQETGKYATGPYVKTAIQTLRDMSYSPKSVRTVQINGKDQGVIRVDPHNLVAFTGLFGFSA